MVGRFRRYLLQHVVRLHELVDKVTRLTVAQLSLGHAGLLQERAQRLHLVPSQVEALLFVPADVDDVLEIRRSGNVRFVDLPWGAPGSGGCRARAGPVHGHVESGRHIRRGYF